MLGVLLIYVALAAKFGLGLESMSIDWFEQKLADFRRRLGTIGFCAALALIFLVSALLYVRLDTHCAHLGYWYAALASDPFNFSTDNQIGYRRLTPAISYLLGLPGRGIIVTNLLFAAAVLFSVARYFITRSSHLVDTVFATAAFAFSLVTLATIHCGGYTDSATYLLIFLLWWFRGRALVFYSMFLLCLLNREAVLFLLPWLALIRIVQLGRGWRWLPDLVIGFGLTIACYAAFRSFVDQNAEVIYSLDYYFADFSEDPLKIFRQTLPFHGLGTFSVFKALWIFPLLAVADQIRERQWTPVVSFALLIGGSYAQLFIAGDTSRMMTMAFMCLPLSLLYLFEGNKFRVRSWAGWVFLANLAIPTVYTAFTEIEIWQPQWRTWLIQLLK